MDIKEYISSGIIETYVLGLASEPDRAEFEQLCRQYPELAAARQEFEIQLEKKALELAIQAPDAARENILDAIRSNKTDSSPARVISMEARQAAAGWRYVAAAAVVLLAACAWFIFDLYSRNNRLEQAVTRFQVRVDSLTNQLAFEHEMMSNPDVAVVSMVGGEKSGSAAKVFWDTASSDVYMVVKNLPRLPSDKQFQLWSFINGKPVDLGLFDLPAGKNVVLKMKNTQNAEAFAITIEDRGNGPIPHGTVETQGKIKL